ncbi:MAG: hypothetical protein IT285_02840 [Bdellovibrionales bacterium]|nr:hypothetical protein [Bdellovibrionales bacterium]
MDLKHVIVSMKGDRVAKVECRTCKKIHAYRAPKGITEAPAPGTPAKPTRARAVKVTVEETWGKVAAQKRAQPGKPYHAQTPFLTGDKVMHPKFGEGFVEELVHPNKVKVLFKDDVRVLIHGGMPQ